MNTMLKTLTGLAAFSALLVPVASQAPAGASTASAASAVPACTNADLVASFHHTDAGAGNRFGRLVLRNVSGHACRTGGFAGLSYVGHGNGTQIGAAASRIGGSSPVTLQPGQRAFSPVDEVVAQNYPAKTCRPTKVDGFRVYVPNSRLAQYVPHPTTGCANPKVHLISEKSLRKA